MKTEEPKDSVFGIQDSGQDKALHQSPIPNPQSPVSGWIILDKPYGMGSTTAVSKVKRLLGKSVKVGHAGTLDPLASGVLPIAVGEATKAIRLAQDAGKEYEFTVKWGFETDSCDLEGRVVSSVQDSGLRIQPEKQAVEEILKKYIGEIQQVPPLFSAVKVNGQRAYDLARSGQEIELTPRNIMIYSFNLLANRPGEADFKVSCGKGTYVRSLARDIGRALGCFATVSALRRLRVGKFSEINAISLEKLEELLYSRAFDRCILPLEFVLDDILAIEFRQAEAEKLRQGQQVPVQPERLENKNCFEVPATCNGKLVAIGSVTSGVFKPERVFNH